MTDENDIVIEQPIDDEAPTPTRSKQSVVDTEPIIEEESMADETAVSPPPPPPPPAPVSQRRGCVLLFFGAILGAISGTVLTLSILLGLNGSLTFASTDAQLRRAINDTRIEQEDMADELATRAAHLDTMATRVGEVYLEQTGVNEAMGTIEAGMGEVQMAVTAVATQVISLDERIETTENQLERAAAAAEEFDAFLSGLKALLLDSDATTATPTANEGTTIGKTPAAGSATPAQTATSEAASTVRATRTPRPTSTPLPLPTSTSEQ